MPCSQFALERSPVHATPRRPRSLAISRIPPAARTSFHASYNPVSIYSRQNASAFNQPLSFDTSSVTTTSEMFLVRFSPWPAPSLQPSSPLHAACTAVGCRLRPLGYAQCPVGSSVHAACTATPPPRTSQPPVSPSKCLGLWLGRARRRCPMQTSCSPVALGRASRPLFQPTVRVGSRVHARRRRSRPCHRRRRP